LGFNTTWAFITGSEQTGCERFDERGLVAALEVMETSRAAWLVEMAAYEDRRRSLKREHRIPADPAEQRYRHGPRWPGPDARAATAAAVDREWNGNRSSLKPHAVRKVLRPLESEMDDLVTAYLDGGLNGEQRRRLLSLMERVDSVTAELGPGHWLGRAASTLQNTGVLIRNEALPLVRRGWTGEAERSTAIFWAARSEMEYLPALYTYEQTAWWVEHVMSPESELWIAERHGVPVGFAALQGDRLEHLYVEPSSQGQGVGEALLDKAKRRRPELHLRVFEQNPGARAFYERSGFALVGASDGSGNEERLPDLHLRWRAGR
jgi:GNAT superfamily N-acetyltransferase